MLSAKRSNTYPVFFDKKYIGVPKSMDSSQVNGLDTLLHQAYRERLFK